MPDRQKRRKKDRDGTLTLPGGGSGGEAEQHGVRRSVAETLRPDTPALEGGDPLPEELTGRASGTNEDLITLFDNVSKAHLADGFRGGSADEPSSSREPDETENLESGDR